MREVVVVLFNIRSTFNIGSFFRTSDAAGVSKIWLSGFTATPAHPHVLKVSLGAEKSVAWEYIPQIEDVMVKLKADGFQIVAAELTDTSIRYREAEFSNKVALIFGYEVGGVPQAVLDQVDLTVHIPMRGQKESLNVAVAGGILIYHLL